MPAVVIAKQRVSQTQYHNTKTDKGDGSIFKNPLFFLSSGFLIQFARGISYDQSSLSDPQKQK